MARGLLCPVASVSFSATLFIATVTTLLTQPGPSYADDFRVETKVFVGEAEDPVGESTTLFIAGDVYDFLKSPAQTAVFRRPKGANPGRFILLNDMRQISTEFTTGELKQVMDRLQTWASRQKDPFLKFAANPNFKETFDQEKSQLILASHIESYTVATKPVEHVRAAQEYREYLDWYAQLNTLLAGGAPPQPRLMLNDALARNKVVPVTVELSRGNGKELLRAEHAFTWRLSKEDMKKIDGVRDSLSSYRKVDNEEFVKMTAADPAK